MNSNINFNITIKKGNIITYGNNINNCDSDSDSSSNSSSISYYVNESDGMKIILI